MGTPAPAPAPLLWDRNENVCGDADVNDGPPAGVGVDVDVAVNKDEEVFQTAVRWDDERDNAEATAPALALDDAKRRIFNILIDSYIVIVIVVVDSSFSFLFLT